MKKLFIPILLAAASLCCKGQSVGDGVIRTICINGGDFGKPFVRKVIALTKKTNPRICFLPTAGADNPYGINWWYELCQDLPMNAYVQRVFLNSSPDQKTFEENLMSMDAIVVGGGSTLNMMGIWKAQGIDTVLRKAYRKGIVMAGGSAGSLCWFTAGLSDSRPKQLSIVECLGFIQASHCPHYHSNPARKPLYQEAVLNRSLAAGYACDDFAGILFENEKYVESFAIDANNHTYYISAADGKIKEELLPVTEILK